MAENKSKRKIGTSLVLAGLFVGLGIGLAVDKTAAGTLVGLGVGFLAAFIYGAMKKK